MGMIKIRNGSITMTVTKEDLTFYKRAGYQVVEELPEKTEPEPVIAEKPEPVTVKERAPRSGKAKIVAEE